MQDLLNYVTNSTAALFDALEYWADILLHRLPLVFGVSFGVWLLAFMFLGIVLGDFLK